MKTKNKPPIKTTNFLLSALIIVLLLLLSPYIGNIEYRSNIEDYFNENEKSLIDYQTLTSNYNNQNSLLLVVSTLQKTHDNTEFDRSSVAPSLLSDANLNYLASLVSTIESHDFISNVSSILDATLILENPDGQKNLTLAQHLKKSALSDTSNQVLYGKLANNLSGNSFWLSSDNRSTVIEVIFSDTENSQKSYLTLLDDLNSITPEQVDLQIKPWGSIAIKAALNQSLLHDGLYLFPIILVVGIVLLYLFIGSLPLIGAGIIAIVTALVLSFELAGVMGASLNQTSVLAFGIVFIISLADVIHVLMCYQGQFSSTEQPDINRAIKHKLKPLCLTTLTTCIGFLSLDAAGSPTFSTFGFIAAGGVVLALITTLFLLPATIELFQNKKARSESESRFEPGPSQGVQPITDRKPLQLLNRMIKHLPIHSDLSQSRSLVFLIVITLIISAGLIRNTYHNDSLTYFPKSSDIRQATLQFEQDFNTHQGLAIMLALPNQDAIYSPTTALMIDDFHQWLAQQPWAGLHTSYTQTLTNIHRGLHENDFRWHRLPKNESQIAELFSLYEMASDKNTLAQLGINKRKATVLISIGIPEMLNRDVLEIQRDIENWFFQHPSSVPATVSGQGILFANVGWNLTQQLLLGAGLTISIITVLIGIVFRNASVAVLSIIPNVLPALVCIGTVGWLSGKINFAIAGSISIALGIVVDDTIHILSDYIRLRRSGRPPQQSIRTTLIETGPALLLTTLVLTAGFSILNFAIFIPNQHTAQMITAMVSSAIIFDFILLPYLLTTFDRWIFPPMTTKIDAQLTTIEQG